jgi:hypothetical protein
MVGVRAHSLALIVVATVSMAPASPARAEWIRDGIPVATEAGHQQYPVAAPDGDGGTILAWQDKRDGVDYDIYVQRIDASGNAVWTAGGVAVCTATAGQSKPDIVSDGAGGAIIAWYDLRGGSNYDIYAQRVNGLGNVLWTANGVPLCTAAGQQQDPKVASDGSGGAIVTWHDSRGANMDVYAQRVNSSGTAMWTSNGVAVCTATANQGSPTIVSDGSGGAIITWEDSRFGPSDIYAQRVNNVGAPQWAANGVQLCGAANVQSSPRITSENSGGAFVAWVDLRSGNYDIYIQWVNASGTTKLDSDGVALCTDGEDQYGLEITSDGLGGAIVAWQDYRSGVDSDIYAQRLNSSGSAAWTLDGVPVCTQVAQQSNPIIVSDGEFGAIISWTDYRSLIDSDVYSQKIDAAGNVMWEANGMPQCTSIGQQHCYSTISDGDGGTYISWYDSRGSTGYDVYVGRVHKDGYWANPAPTIIGIDDLADDQGGMVWVSFAASPIDISPTQGISYYSLWRSIASPVALDMEREAVLLESPAQARPEMAGSAVYFSEMSSWQLVTTIEAHLLEEYSYPVSTLRDSTGLNPGWEYFFVSAHGQDPLKFWDSPTDSGYSVDNLPPAAPSALEAEYIGGTEVYLHWNPNTESDFFHYAVYRGTSASFSPHDSNRVAIVTLPNYVDDGYGYGEEHYYKVSAIDIHGNESPFSLVTPAEILSVPGTGRDYSDALFQNAPNPFASSTSIVFSIAKAGHVRLMVFDAKGRLVRVLIDEVRQANHYVELWDGRDRKGKRAAAGMYFYSLEAPGWKASKKMTLAR